MLNKLKRGVKYIIKKIKRGVDIVTKNINDAKCAVAEVESKKLDLIRDAGSVVYETISNNKIPAAIVILGVGISISGGLISSELLNKEV